MSYGLFLNIAVLFIIFISTRQWLFMLTRNLHFHLFFNLELYGSAPFWLNI